MKKIKLTDFNAEFKEENKITNYNPLNKDKSFTEDGVFSETIFGDMADDENEEIGWIDLEEHYIINPVMFKHLERLLGTKKLNKIISYDKLISREGEIEEENEEDEEDDNIGLKEFKDNFVRIINDWGNQKKYPEEYKFIMANMKYVWINKFPVLNAKQRPATVISNTITFDEINNEYNMILRYLKEITGIKAEYIVMPLLYNIQMFANKIFMTIIKDYLMGKRGWLRKNNLGSKINFSARFVITPKINAPIDEVDIPYIGACELYKYQLVSMISASKNINYIEAEKIWRQKSLKFDEEMYKYLMLLKNKTKTGLRILLNRNPTLAIGSIFFLRIGEIKKDYSDLTLSISNNLLVSLAGDFDGDVLNVVPIFDEDMKKTFEILSPINLIISNNDGKFNKKLSLDKDQIIGIHILNH